MIEFEPLQPAHLIAAGHTDPSLLGAAEEEGRMLLADRLGLAAVGELGGGVLTDGCQQPVARLLAVLDDLNQ